MLRRIITITISLAIIIAGIIGFNRLHYFDRSARIFKTNSTQSYRGGHFDRGGEEGRNFKSQRGTYDENQQRNFQNLPDSLQQKMIGENEFASANDSTREGRTRAFAGDRSEFRERGSGDRGRGGHDFRRGKSVQLGSVGWFLAVFAGFTLITILIDDRICSIRRQKKRQQADTQQ